MVVYPRWRGELDRTASVVSSGSGLSPLARGTPVFANLWTIAIRFIPAGAGNTTSGCRRSAWSPVYPRWRGEHCMALASSLTDAGLSPLARGTRIKHGLTRRAARFIPAGAGNTPRLFKRGRRGSVYPRWRGEHDRLRHLAVADQGLSPLARGTPRQKVNAAKNERFIPAGAGNTIKKLFCVSFRSVYPRWRGEHFYSVNNRSLIVGLSPLARGTL